MDTPFILAVIIVRIYSRNVYFCKFKDSNSLQTEKYTVMKASVGNKIRSLRESKGIELDVLAERAQLPPAQIKEIEEGGPLPGLAPLIKIARVLGVRLGTFLDDSQSIGAVVS